MAQTANSTYGSSSSASGREAADNFERHEGEGHAAGQSDGREGFRHHA